MKRILIITSLLIALLLNCTGCVVTLPGEENYPSQTEGVLSGTQLVENQGNVPASETNTNDVQNQNKFDKTEVLSKLEVKTYKMSRSVWNYAFIEIANNSDYDLSISVDLKYYDAAGALIGADSRSEDPVQSGTSVLIYTMPDEDFATIEYDVSVDTKSSYYECVVKDLSYESVAAKNKEIVTVKNDGTEAAEFVEGSMLFFLGDKVVGYASHYFTDNDSELKPGKSKTVEMDCNETYDSYKIFFTGRK